MRPGRRLGIDVGQARVGVALSDPDALLATPVESAVRDLVGGADIERIAALCREHEVVEVVVGLPLSLSGAEGPAAATARAYALALAAAIRPISVRLLDERLTTVQAHRGLRAAGRSTRTHRPVVDQQAAVLILQGALDVERASGSPPGERLQSRKPRSTRRGT